MDVHTSSSPSKGLHYKLQVVLLCMSGLPIYALAAHGHCVHVHIHLNTLCVHTVTVNPQVHVPNYTLVTKWSNLLAEL